MSKNPTSLDRKALKALIKKAIRSGELDISNRTIDFDFNLVELLLECKQQKQPNQNQSLIPDFVECPFAISAWNTVFNGCFLTFISNRINLVFLREVHFENATFSGATFESARFKQKALFSLATFGSSGQCANYTKAIFEDKVNFVKAEFKTPTYFEKVDFYDDVDFQNSTFEKKAEFKDTIFKKHTSFKEILLINNCTLSFDKITTHGNFEIMPTSLQGNINITSTTFESDKSSLVVDLALCDETTSLGTVRFQNLDISHDRMCLKIRNLKEEALNVEVSFQDCGFYGKNVVFTKVAMEQVSITGGSYVAGMGFYLCYWKKETAFAWLKFRAFNRLENTDPLKKTSALEKVESYGYLKVSALDAGDAQLSNDFHFWHQWYQKESKFWNPFYLHTSAYGLSTLLPFIYFFLVLFLGGIFYNFLADEFATVSITSVQKSFCSQIMVYVCEIKGYIVSISASLPFVFSDSKLVESLLPELPENAKRLKTGLFYFGYILQHLIQGYLLFQIGAAIRNKVKR